MRATASLSRLAVAAVAVGAAATALLAAPSTRPVAAQEPGTLRADIAGVTDGDYPSARAVVNVDDVSGADLSGLNASNFAVTVDGKPAPISAAELASSQNLPLDVLLVIDTTGSMAGEPIAQAKQAAKDFLAGLAPEDRVALMRIAEDAVLVQDYTTVRTSTQEAIDGLEARGNTALYNATVAAALKIGGATASRRAVIFLSDAAENNVAVTVTREQAIDAAAAAGAPFFTIGEGDGIDRPYLQQLAQVSRGRYLEAPDPKDLGALYAGIGRLLRSQYLVTFDASDAVPAGSAISVTLTSGAATATASATYKPGAGFAPSSITLEGVEEGEKLEGARAITLGGGAGAGTRAAFYVDGVNVFETEAKPFTYTYDSRSFSAGEHTIKASVSFGPRTVESDSPTFTSNPPAPPPSGGGLPLLPILGIALALIIGVPVVIVVMRLRTMHGEGTLAAERVVARARPVLVPPPAPAAGSDEELIVPEEIGEPLGVLVSRSGSDLGHEYTVGGSPVRIGSAVRCGVRVQDEELAAEEARIWVSKGHLMLHKMTKLTTIVAEGTSGGWQILEPGDTFEIGQHTFEFRLLRAAAPDPDPVDVPNALHDPDVPTAGEPAAPPQGAPPSLMPSPQGRVSSFSQLMPKNDVGPND